MVAVVAVMFGVFAAGFDHPSDLQEHTYDAEG
jgi:hypothetical protein